MSMDWVQRDLRNAPGEHLCELWWDWTPSRSLLTKSLLVMLLKWVQRQRPDRLPRCLTLPLDDWVWKKVS